MPKHYLPIFAILTSSALLSSSFITQSNDSTTKHTPAPSVSPVAEIKVDFTVLAKKAIPAVVSIQVKATKSSVFSDDNPDIFDFFGGDFGRFFNTPRKNGHSSPMMGQASGFIVSSDGLIITNSHVVHGVDSITVQLTDGRQFEAKLIGEDSNSDVALIKIEANDLPFLQLGDSDIIEVGEWVAAIGNPLGLEGTLTHGVVSAKGRNNLDISRFEDYIQTDAAIYKGNSGGPLLNLKGEVIGVNTAIATNASSSYLGIGFAIPSNAVRHIMEEIQTDGKVSRGYIGVGLQSIDYSLAQAFNLAKVEGALISNVVKDSPADKAGLKTEDIILKYNNIPVVSSAAFSNAVYLIRPGTQITLTILRGDKTLQIPLVVGDYKEDSKNENNPSPSTNRLGVEVEELSSENAKAFGYHEDKGVVISKVLPGSPAAFTGLKKGSLILSVNRNKTESIGQFNQAMQSAPKDKPLLLQVKQGQQYVFVSIKVE